MDCLSTDQLLTIGTEIFETFWKIQWLVDSNEESHRVTSEEQNVYDQCYHRRSKSVEKKKISREAEMVRYNKTAQCRIRKLVLGVYSDKPQTAPQPQSRGSEPIHFINYLGFCIQFLSVI